MHYEGEQHIFLHRYPRSTSVAAGRRALSRTKRDRREILRVIRKAGPLIDDEGYILTGINPNSYRARRNELAGNVKTRKEQFPVMIVRNGKKHKNDRDNLCEEWVALPFLKLVRIGDSDGNGKEGTVRGKASRSIRLKRKGPNGEWR